MILFNKKSLSLRIRDFIIPCICYFFLVLLVINNPHTFTYIVGRNFSLFIIALVIFLEYFFIAGKNEILDKANIFYNKYFSWILLLSISIFILALLNEKLYSLIPGKHSHYNGCFTIGGIIPNSDSADYFSDIQSFLKYGIMTSSAIYRPLASLVAAVLYNLSGENIIYFFYLTSFLIIFAVFRFATVLSIQLNKSLAILSAFCLCLYFGLFQATFMTEIVGGIVGLIAIATLLEGFLKKNKLLFYLGIILLAFSFQMRAGAFIIVPILLLFGSTRFSSKYKISLKTYVISATLFLVVSLSPKIQLNYFSNKIITQSNVGDIIYMIQVDAPKWNQIRLDYPDYFSSKTAYQKAKLSNEIAINKLKGDPATFIHNYFSRMFLNMKNPQKYFFRFSNSISDLVGNSLLLLFLFTPFLYHRKSGMHILFWFLIVGFLGSILSSPMLDAAKTRAYAATIAVNIMAFSLAICNALYLLKNIIGITSNLNWNFLKKKKWYVLKLKKSFLQIKVANKKTGSFKVSLYLNVFIILFILIGPVILDKYRSYIAPDIKIIAPETIVTENVFLLSVSDSPYALIDPINDFQVNNPLIIPKSKFDSNNRLDTTFTARFYLFNALNHADFRKSNLRAPYLLLSEALLRNISLNNISMLVLKVEYIKPGLHRLIIVKEISKIIYEK